MHRRREPHSGLLYFQSVNSSEEPFPVCLSLECCMGTDCAENLPLSFCNITPFFSLQAFRRWQTFLLDYRQTHPSSLYWLYHLCLRQVQLLDNWGKGWGGGQRLWSLSVALKYLLIKNTSMTQILDCGLLTHDKKQEGRLHLRMKLLMSLVKHLNRLLKEVLDVPSLGTF